MHWQVLDSNSEKKSDAAPHKIKRGGNSEEVTENTEAREMPGGDLVNDAGDALNATHQAFAGRLRGTYRRSSALVLVPGVVPSHGGG